MSITYAVTEEVYVLGQSRRIAYGIAAYADSAEEGTSAIVASVRDVAGSRSPLEHLVTLCNELNLDPDHLYDVVEDYLGQL